MTLKRLLALSRLHMISETTTRLGPKQLQSQYPTRLEWLSIAHGSLRTRKRPSDSWEYGYAFVDTPTSLAPKITIDDSDL